MNTIEVPRTGLSRLLDHAPQTEGSRYLEFAKPLAADTQHVARLLLLNGNRVLRDDFFGMCVGLGALMRCVISREPRANPRARGGYDVAVRAHTEHGNTPGTELCIRQGIQSSGILHDLSGSVTYDFGNGRETQQLGACNLGRIPLSREPASALGRLAFNISVGLADAIEIPAYEMW